MKLLREYIRELLTEDLGEKVWAQKAPEGSRHQGEEEDQEEHREYEVGSNEEPSYYSTSSLIDSCLLKQVVFSHEYRDEDFHS